MRSATGKVIGSGLSLTSSSWSWYSKGAQAGTSGSLSVNKDTCVSGTVGAERMAFLERRRFAPPLPDEVHVHAVGHVFFVCLHLQHLTNALVFFYRSEKELSI